MTSTLTISDRSEAWSSSLERIAATPLSCCLRFPEIAERWERWWRFDADRPLLIASAGKNPDIRWDKGFDLLDQPRLWLQMRRRQVENTHYVAEALPHVRVDIGPVSIAAFVGAPLTLSVREGTIWQDAILNDWEDTAFLRFDLDNWWYRTVLKLSKIVADDAAGDYLVCLPDLTGAIDTLSNLRGPQRLCTDLMDHRTEITASAERLVGVWEPIFASLHDAVLARGAGIIQWLGAWSNQPYTLPTCDFNFMISPRDFEEVCMPSLSGQATRAGRCLFHLDGPGASRHAETLAGDASITAIQYTPGEARPSAVEKLEMLEMIQAHAKPVLIIAPAGEVERLTKTLDPRGLAILVNDVQSPGHADQLERIVANC
ncbi:MAG: hypothetical protein O2923_02755 [Verrucomicrobia bacterium]|nr:hypothetical protein [Verrucomicrobiota bacterium]MDA1086577.1 hypothetical protein [Verrucomicrobiota bacterium]